MIKFVIFAMLVAFSGATTFSACTSKPAPTAVRVTGCTSQPCTIVKGNTYTLEIDFTVTTYTSSLSASVVVNYFGIPYSYSVPGDLCPNLANGVTCPLAAQQSATYALTFTPDSSTPDFDGSIQITIKNQSNGVVACFSIQVKVVDP